jgi:hypothetical protein
LIAIASLGAAVFIARESGAGGWIVLFVAAALGALAYQFGIWIRSSQPRAKKMLEALKPPKSREEARERFDQLTGGRWSPQLESLDFDATGNPAFLNRYFPIVNMLDETSIESFHDLIRYVADHPNFEVQLFGANKTNVTHRMPNSIRWLAAGHLAETFFHRRDILERFLHTPRHFHFYIDEDAFRDDGGVKGGNFSPSRQCIQLVLSRLFAGFDGATPGACPFLHELGHMLDHFDARTGTMGKPKGMYPGLSPDDGDVFTPQARIAFIKGKRLELDRYLARHHGDFSQPMPIGSPYVFQSDGEFAAGYMEAFFRNPNYFSAQNPDLFDAYVQLFGYDPRKAWKEDYPNYVKKNRGMYSSGEPLKNPGLTIPIDA